MDIVFATRNHHKIREFNEILAGSPIVARALPAGAPDVEETGDTFLANAALKAISAWNYTGLPSLADDSGLCVDALGGHPGVVSARFASLAGVPVHADVDAANNAYLVASLRDATNRSAHYECVLALVVPSAFVGSGALDDVERYDRFDGLPTGTSLVATRGRLEGRIVDTPKGAGGFGYDPYFYVPGFATTLASISSEQKHAISHRGIAMRALAHWLTQSQSQ